MTTPTLPTYSRADFPNLTPMAPPKKRRRWPWVLVGIFGTFAVLIGGCAALIGGAAKQIADDAADEAAEVADGGVSNGAGSRDATADVGTPTMTPEDSLGLSFIQTRPVTNHSSGRSDYMIEVVVSPPMEPRSLRPPWRS